MGRTVTVTPSRRLPARADVARVRVDGHVAVAARLGRGGRDRRPRAGGVDLARRHDEGGDLERPDLRQLARELGERPERALAGGDLRRGHPARAGEQRRDAARPHERLDDRGVERRERDHRLPDEADGAPPPEADDRPEDRVPRHGHVELGPPHPLPGRVAVAHPDRGEEPLQLRGGELVPPSLERAADNLPRAVEVRHGVGGERTRDLPEQALVPRVAREERERLHRALRRRHLRDAGLDEARAGAADELLAHPARDERLRLAAARRDDRLRALGGLRERLRREHREHAVDVRIGEAELDRRPVARRIGVAEEIDGVRVGAGGREGRVEPRAGVVRERRDDHAQIGGAVGGEQARAPRVRDDRQAIPAHRARGREEPRRREHPLDRRDAHRAGPGERRVERVVGDPAARPGPPPLRPRLHHHDRLEARGEPQAAQERARGADGLDVQEDALRRGVEREVLEDLAEVDVEARPRATPPSRTRSGAPPPSRARSRRSRPTGRRGRAIPGLALPAVKDALSRAPGRISPTLFGPKRRSPPRAASARSARVSRSSPPPRAPRRRPPPGSRRRRRRAPRRRARESGTAATGDAMIARSTSPSTSSSEDW